VLIKKILCKLTKKKAKKHQKKLIFLFC